MPTDAVSHSVPRHLKCCLKEPVSSMLGRGSGLPVDACIDVLAISPKDSSSGEGRGRPDSIRSGGVAIVQGSLHESLSLVNTEL